MLSNIKNDIESLAKNAERRHNLVMQLLQGNGEPSKGLVVRVDRIEQRWVTIYGVISAIVLPLLWLVGDKLWDVFSRGGN